LGKATTMNKRTTRMRTLFGVAAALLLTLPSLVAAQDEPQHGGTLIYAIGSDPHTLNPAITTDAEALAVSCKMFNGLVWIDRDLVVQPELAESWDISEDGL